MKRILITLSLLLGALAGQAQDRIYVFTDRPAYAAGDMVYCSLFCTDENGRISDFSAVSYLELISNEGTATEAKIALFEGRGAGSFRIPGQVPTGNYALVAYTARSQAVPEGSRTLAVFNTGSTTRVKEGVTLVPESQYRPFFQEDPPAEGGLSLSLPARLRIGQEATLVLGGLDCDADLAVSVSLDDGLAPADGKSLSAFLHGQPAAPGPRMGEYEGEVIYATVEGMKKDDDRVTAILSTAGSPSNVYLGRSTEDGRIRFVTDNIYGDRELVCDVSTMQGQDCHINLASPFTHPTIEALPPLVLSAAQRSALVNRKSVLQTPEAQDTLERFLPKRENLLLETARMVRYHLDDYNRFPTVKEICVEFIPELQFTKKDGRWNIRMVKTDGLDARKFIQDNILVMMDGVVLSDHGMLEDFDAMLLEDVDIYPDAIIIGGLSFNGVVNFVSKKNYVTALHFPANVRVVDFKGVSYPVWYPGTVPAVREKDRRQLLYWHPAQEVKAGESLRIPLHMPAYAGRFKVVAEGWTKNGTPVRAEYSFEVE